MDFLLSLIGSLVGAGVVASFALHRYRSERLFDLRLEWYTRMIGSTQDFRKEVFDRWQDCQREFSVDLSPEFFRLESAFLHDAHEGWLHVDPAWSGAFSEIVGAVATASYDVTLAAGPLGRPPPELEFVLHNLYRALGGFSEYVVNDARRYLGRPPLERRRRPRHGKARGQRLGEPPPPP
jgi:hypothetical protein